MGHLFGGRLHPVFPLALGPVHGLVRPAEEGASFPVVGWLIIVVGIAIGGGFGFWQARTVKMTAMPQLVSLFNAVGGGAAALIAIDDYLKLTAVPDPQVNVATVLDIVIGSITFTGSLIASGKLMGLRITPSRPVRIPGGQLVTLALALMGHGLRHAASRRLFSALVCHACHGVSEFHCCPPA